MLHARVRAFTMTAIAPSTDRDDRHVVEGLTGVDPHELRSGEQHRRAQQREGADAATRPDAPRREQGDDQPAEAERASSASVPRNSIPMAWITSPPAG